MSTGHAAEPFWDDVRALFHECAALDPADRAARLGACADPALRAEVESLLAEHDGAAGFLDRSVWDVAAGVAADAPTHAHIGPYQVVRPLGHGGMGSVFLAARDDAQFEQRVAIKLVRGGAAGAALLGRFRQERQILAALEHPNIARLLDGGATADGLPYLVMEYVEGTPIDVYCRERSLPVAVRLRLFLDLCDAVQYAHRNLVIHRDIKPANVLVTSDGIPKLLDFGIAKLTSDEVPGDATVTRLMTPDYASPEQLAGLPVTTASDVYSLGVLLFELLTGTRPFAGRTRTNETEAPRPSSVAAPAGARGLRGDLDRIVLMALERDPQRRYGSVDKLADDVRRHLDGHPVLALGASFPYRATKFVRRNRLAVAAAAVAMTAIVAAFALTLQQKRIAERRFGDVRSLAHSMVFELHDAIAKLPGSTPARELLIRRALQYLDALSAESANNTPLEMELAGAYERIGDVQGMPYRPNLGDSAGALASYRKAIAIAGQVQRREPGNAAALALLADVHDHAGLIEQRAIRYRSALQHHEAARMLRERLPHTIGNDLALVRTWVGIADCVYLSSGLIPIVRGTSTPVSLYETALHLLERIKPDAAHRRDWLAEVARVHQRLGGYYTNGTWRDPPRALQHHEVAKRALEERMRLDPDDSIARRGYADHLVMIATLQSSTGDAAGALDGTIRAQPVFVELAAADPTNVEAQHDLAFLYEQQGRALTHLGRYDEAERALETGLTIRQRLIAANPTNREDLRGVGSFYGHLADLAYARGDRKKGDALRAEALKTHEGLKR
ncbi:MAG: serine/threonine protein kinase with repeat [Acidobacteria bacterium]|nr:serine/threonine protein kinase with repeat [Acidobacteriota bacterium]